MKKILYPILLVSLTIVPMNFSSCSDDDDDENNNKTNTETNLKFTVTFYGEVAVTGFKDTDNGTVDGRSDTSTSLVIPSQVIIDGKTYRVTSIADHAFEFCPNLESVTIPSTVAKIGEKAFADCGSLTNLSITNSVEVIGDYAFEGCESLTTVKIPTGVSKIGTGTFKNCTGLSNLSIPTNVSYIGAEAFESCSNLTNVSIPSSVDTIFNDAFNGCTKADVVISLDYGAVPYMGEDAFSNVHSLVMGNNVFDFKVENSNFESGSIGDYAYVDLGLPSGLKWATYDLGATSIFQIGDYYGEGDRFIYNWPDDPVNTATSKWGSSWRIPTNDELQELIDGCEWRWYVFNGVSGKLGTSKTNGHQIFLPKGESDGGFWSSKSNEYWWTPSTPSQGRTVYSPYYLEFDYTNISVDYYYGYYSGDGRFIRPVSD